MWSKAEIDFETARDSASKLVLIGAAQKAGLFEALSEEKDIAALKRMLGADERALYIVLEALFALGYVDKRKDRYVIADKARSLFLERGEDYVGGSLPHFLDIMKAWLLLPEIIKGKKPSEEERDISAFMNAMAARPDNVVDDSVKHCLKRKKDAKDTDDDQPKEKEVVEALDLLSHRFRRCGLGWMAARPSVLGPGGGA